MSCTGTGHRVLVVEDDPVAAEDVRALLESRGDSVRLAATVEEALAALEEETFCYVVLDQQLPTRAGEPPLVGGGERVLRACRMKDDRRVGAFHTTPIVILTSYSGHEDFVSKMYDLGASAFMSKPLRGNFERMLDKVRVVLERAKRGEHAACAGLGEGPKKAEAAPEPGEKARSGGIAAQVGASAFAEIALRVVDGHTLRITHDRKVARATYIDLGLATKTKNPTQEWALLLDVCAGHGTFRWAQYGTKNNAKQRVYLLRKRLKEAFGLEDEPFRYSPKERGWRALFFASSAIAGEGG